MPQLSFIQCTVCHYMIYNTDSLWSLISVLIAKTTDYIPCLFGMKQLKKLWKKTSKTPIVMFRWTREEGGGHAAMSPSISCSNPGRTPRNTFQVQPKTAQNKKLLSIIDLKKKKIQKMKRCGNRLYTPFRFELKINALQLFFSEKRCLPRFNKYFRRNFRNDEKVICKIFLIMNLSIINEL